MSKVRIEFDQRELKRLERDVTARLEKDLNKELQAVIRQVRKEMSGQPADKIHSTLKSRLARRIPGFRAGPDLRQVAQAISDGELID